MASDSDFSDLDLDDMLSMADELDSQDSPGPSQPEEPVQKPKVSPQNKPNPTKNQQPNEPSPRKSVPDSKPELQSTTPLPENGTQFLRVACSCGYRMRLKPNKAGATIKCPKCKSAIRVPKSADEEGPPKGELIGHGFDTAWDELTSELSKEIESLVEQKTLSSFSFRSLKRSVQSISTGRFDLDNVRAAVDQLGESRDSRAYPILEEAWMEEAPNLQSAILGAMGQSQDPRALLFLLRLLKNPMPEVRLATVQSLAFTEDERIVKVLVYYGQSHPELKYAVGDSLLKLKGLAIDPFVELLQSSNTQIVEDAVILLGRLKTSDAIKPLMETFQTHPGRIQGYVAEALGLIGEPKSIPALTPLLNSPDEKIRIQAASAMGRVPHPGCLKALIDSLQDPNAEVRKRCATALGEIGDRRAAPALAKLLKDENTELRITAAEALGRIGDERAVPYLIQMTQDEDEAVLLKALGALRKIKDPKSIDPLIELLSHESSRVRQRSIDVLGQVGDAVVAEQLEQMLRNDRSEDVRSAAAKALGEIRDPGSVDSLIEALHDAFAVKCRAIVALGEIGEESSLASLLAMLKDPAPEVRYHASQALSQMGHELAAKNIRPLLDDSNAMVRRGAAKALETLGQGDAEDILGSETQRGLRRGLKNFKNSLAAISPGAFADAIQHGSTATKAIVGGVMLTPILCLAGYYLLFTGPSKDEQIALLNRANVKSLDISPDGSVVIAGRTKGLIEIWDVEDGSLEDAFKPVRASVEMIGVMTVPGKTEVVFTSGGKTGCYDYAADKMLWEITTHTSPIKVMIPSFDRKKVMFADPSGVVSFWDATTGQPIGTGALALPPTMVKGLALSNNGELLASYGTDSTITFWSTIDGTETATLETYPKDIVRSVRFSPDDSLLAVQLKSGLLTVIDRESGNKVYELPEPFQTPNGMVTFPIALGFNADASKLKGFLNRELLFIDIVSGEITQQPSDIPGNASAFAKQSNGTLIAIGDVDDSTVYVLDSETGKYRTQLDK